MGIGGRSGRQSVGGRGGRFQQIIQAYAEFFAELDQAVEIGRGLPGFPLGHRLSRHVHTLGQFFLGQAHKLSAALDFPAESDASFRHAHKVGFGAPKDNLQGRENFDFLRPTPDGMQAGRGGSRLPPRQERSLPD